MSIQYGLDQSVNRIKQKTKNTTLLEQFPNPIEKSQRGKIDTVPHILEICPPSKFKKNDTYTIQVMSMDQ